MARLVTAAAVGIAVVVVAVVFFVAATKARNDNREAARAQTSQLVRPGDQSLVGGIGPAPGADINRYTADRRQVLAAATGDRIAVVSLAEYGIEDRARAAAGKLPVVALLAAAPGGRPSVVTGDLDDWVEDQIKASVEERDELRKLLPDVQAPEYADFRIEYQSQIDRLTKLIDGVKPGSALVFGVVVRGPAPELQALANADGVRLVDVGSNPDPPEGDDYRGLRPEEMVKAGEPPTRPIG